MNERAVVFPVGDIQLEGRLGQPTQGVDRGGLVVCHPHPRFGGDLSNHVVANLCQAGAAAGLVTLRFNFRGTGRSGGEHTDGQQEPADVRAAVDFLAAETGLPVESIGLAGYSFGALMMLSAGLADDRVPALAAVSPPLTRRPIPALAETTKPVVIISGSADDFVDPVVLTELGQQCPGVIEVRLFDGEDHFWWTNAKEAAQVAVNFLLPHLDQSAQ